MKHLPGPALEDARAALARLTTKARQCIEATHKPGAFEAVSSERARKRTALDEITVDARVVGEYLARAHGTAEDLRDALASGDAGDYEKALHRERAANIRRERERDKRVGPSEVDAPEPEPTPQAKAEAHEKALHRERAANVRQERERDKRVGPSEVDGDATCLPCEAAKRARAANADEADEGDEEDDDFEEPGDVDPFDGAVDDGEDDDDADLLEADDFGGG